ncbi:hypothetical protein [Pseudoclavibacter helvolus]|uniref:hypothetical protein n=1 Tax=Pseudoclavibacter helvolus TaxID=255205 RepID=UPI00373569D5
MLWEDYPELPEGEFDAVVELALRVDATPAEQYAAARDFLASLADNDERSSRARGGIEPASHLHLVHGLAPVAETSVERGAFVWHVPEGVVVDPSSPFDPPAARQVPNVSYEQAVAALELFEKSSFLGTPIDAMWEVLKTDRERFSTVEQECEAVVVDGSRVLVRGHLGPEDREMFEGVVKSAEEFVRDQPAQPCHSPRCDYEEPHDHGFACGRGCLCGRGGH